MNDKNKSTKLVHSRAQALAVMLLTRRSDLLIHAENGGFGVDLVVDIVREAGHKQFGVEVTATVAPVTIEHANSILRPKLQNLLRHGPYSFPVCLLYFTMQDNRGYFSWVVEPVIMDGRALLNEQLRPDVSVLVESTIDDMVDRIDDWYEAFYQHLYRREKFKKS